MTPVVEGDQSKRRWQNSDRSSAFFAEAVPAQRLTRSCGLSSRGALGGTGPHGAMVVRLSLQAAGWRRGHPPQVRNLTRERPARFLLPIGMELGI